MDITVSWFPPNETATECLCTIYTTAHECDEQTSACVYEWFLILVAVMAVFIAASLVTRAVYNMVRRIDATSQLVERFAQHRNTHLH